VIVMLFESESVSLFDRLSKCTYKFKLSGYYIYDHVLSFALNGDILASRTRIGVQHRLVGARYLASSAELNH
jgi:hypothetical protein